MSSKENQPRLSNGSAGSTKSSSSSPSSPSSVSSSGTGRRRTCAQKNKASKVKKAKDKAMAEAVRQADLKETEAICQVFRAKDEANGLVLVATPASTNNGRGCPPKKANVSPTTRAKLDRRNKRQNALRQRKKEAVSLFHC